MSNDMSLCSCTALGSIPPLLALFVPLEEQFFPRRTTRQEKKRTKLCTLACVYLTFLSSSPTSSSEMIVVVIMMLPSLKANGMPSKSHPDSGRSLLL